MGQRDVRGSQSRNDLRQEESYAIVQQQGSDGQWTTVRDDTDWELLFNWQRTNTLLGNSEVTLSWDTSFSAMLGTYRIEYFGAAKKAFTGSIEQIQGTSSTFNVV